MNTQTDSRRLPFALSFWFGLVVVLMATLPYGPMPTWSYAGFFLIGFAPLWLLSPIFLCVRFLRQSQRVKKLAPFLKYLGRLTVFLLLLTAIQQVASHAGDNSPGRPYLRCALANFAFLILAVSIGTGLVARLRE